MIKKLYLKAHVFISAKLTTFWYLTNRRIYHLKTNLIMLIFYRSSRPEVFLRKGVLKICCKFTGVHPCRSVISIKLQSKFIEIALRLGCSPVNLLHISRTPFPKNTSGCLLLFLGHPS